MKASYLVLVVSLSVLVGASSAMAYETRRPVLTETKAAAGGVVRGVGQAAETTGRWVGGAVKTTGRVTKGAVNDVGAWFEW